MNNKKTFFYFNLIIFILIFYLINFDNIPKVFGQWNNCSPQCQSGESCVFMGARWQCVAGATCSSNSDCATGFVCLNGHCTNKDAPGVQNSVIQNYESENRNENQNLNDWSGSCDGEPSLLWKNIPIEEVKKLYGDTIVNNIKKMACSVSPSQIRELDRWTGGIHFEYRLPSGIPTGNANIWIYDLATGQVSWSGPGPAPFSAEEAIRRIRNYLGGSSPSQISSPSQNTTQDIIFIANLPRDSQGNYLAYVGQAITYTWSIPNAGVITSSYTADAPDNCPGGLTRSGQEGVWEAKTASGTRTDVVQSCQLGRTYTITIKNNNQPVASIKIKIVNRSDASASQPSVFNPLDIDYYRGPLTLSFENRQRLTTGQQITTTQPQQTTALTGLDNFSIQTLTVLTSILERLTGILNSSSNLPSEARNQITQQITQTVQLVNSIIQQVLNRVGSNS